MGIHPEEFWELGEADLYRRFEAFEYANNRELYNVRLLAAYVINSNPYLKTEIQPKDLFYLPQDGIKKEKKKLTLKQIINQTKEASKFLNIHPKYLN